MGTGIHRIQQSLAAGNAPAAQFDYDGFFTLTFPRVAEEVAEEMAKEILQHLQATPQIATADLAAALSSSSRTIQRKLRSLQDSGHIQRIGSPQKGTWQVLISLPQSKQTPPQSRQSTTTVATAVSPDLAEEIIARIRQQPEITTQTLADQLSRSARTINRQLAALKQTGRLTRVGSTKAGHWHIIDVRT